MSDLRLIAETLRSALQRHRAAWWVGDMRDDLSFRIITSNAEGDVSAEVLFLPNTHQDQELNARADAAALPDPVDHPAHYGGKHNVYEAIKVIRAWKLSFCLGNTVKYLCRAGKKDPTKTLEDLRKARWYLDEAIREAEEDAK